MKRTLLSFILAIGMTANIWADTVIEGIKYALNDDFTATVTGLDDPSFTGTVTIPETIKYYGNTYQVVQIGDKAFFEYKFKSVVIPNSVTSIGDGAFSGCSGLTSVTINSNEIMSKSYSGSSNLSTIFGNQVQTYIIGDSVTSIGDGAFSGCSGLTSVTINSNEIMSKSYSGSSNLSTIFGNQVQTYIIGDSVTSIGEYAFFKCSGLTSVTIPNSVTSIGEHAFYRCTGLTSVTIPNSVISIGNDAFLGCSGLTFVTIGSFAESIGIGAFAICSGLTEINVDENNTTYSSIDGVLFNKSQTELIQYPGGKQGAYTIPNSVTSIRNQAFSDCSELTSVTIPNSVTKIEDYAFYGCTGLTSVTINSNAIMSKSNISSSNMSDIFGSQVKSYTIGDSVTVIRGGAFSNCKGLTSVTIGNSVKSIGNNAFYYCTGLTSVTIPNSVTIIGDYAFRDCRGLTSIDIPNSVKSIGREAFYNCRSLTSVTIGNSVTSIGHYAFYNCTGLTSVTIPNSVKSIGREAFYNCSSLTSVTIGNSVTSIGSSAFEYCTSLTAIYCHIEEPLMVESSVFKDVPKRPCTLHVPIGSKVKYQAADVWKSFLNIVEDLPTGIVSIDNSQSTIDNDVWYTLNGVRLNGKPTIPGIYIVNGLKVVIK